MEILDPITVDGDHSETGAAQDLRAVIPRLKLVAAPAVRKRA